MTIFSRQAVLSVLIFSSIVGFGFSIPEFAVHKQVSIPPTTTPEMAPLEESLPPTTTVASEPIVNQVELFEAGDCAFCERHSPLGIYNPEPLNQCGPHRRFLAKGFPRILPELKTSISEGFKIPKACVAHIARTFAGEGKPSADFAECKVEGAKKRIHMGGVPACISETYVNTVFHSLNDVFDCFDLDVKSYLPIFTQAGGLNLNAVGRENLGTGIGQIQPLNVADVHTGLISLDGERGRAFDLAKQYILKNKNKKGCERLSLQIGSLDKVKLSPKSTRWESDAERCRLMDLPESPSLNLFYLAAQHLRSQEVIEKLFEVRTLKLLEMAKLDLNLSQKTQLKEVIRVLGGEMGSGRAVSILNSYLQAKISFNHKVEISDFDLFKEPRPQDPSLRDSELSFMEYLIRFGYRDLLVFVRKNQDLNQIFPEGVCAQKAFSLE